MRDGAAGEGVDVDGVTHPQQVRHAARGPPLLLPHHGRHVGNGGGGSGLLVTGRAGTNWRQAAEEGGCAGWSEEIGSVGLRARRVRVGGGRRRRRLLVGSESEEDGPDPVGARRSGGQWCSRALEGRR